MKCIERHCWWPCEFIVKSLRSRRRFVLRKEGEESEPESPSSGHCLIKESVGGIKSVAQQRSIVSSFFWENRQ